MVANQIPTVSPFLGSESAPVVFQDLIACSMIMSRQWKHERGVVQWSEHGTTQEPVVRIQSPLGADVI